jgi:hypothetical protein
MMRVVVRYVDALPERAHEAFATLAQEALRGRLALQTPIIDLRPESRRGHYFLAMHRVKREVQRELFDRLDLACAWWARHNPGSGP